MSMWWDVVHPTVARERVLLRSEWVAWCGTPTAFEACGWGGGLTRGRLSASYLVVPSFAINQCFIKSNKMRIS